MSAVAFCCKASCAGATKCTWLLESSIRVCEEQAVSETQISTSTRCGVEVCCAANTSKCCLVADLTELAPNEFLSPFLEVIRSEDTTGPITGLALTSVNKFLSYSLIGNSFHLFHAL